MEHISTMEVVNLLRDYPELVKERDVLRYELDHSVSVSDQEMIEAMNYKKGTGAMPLPGSVSNKTLYIMMNYKERVAEVNAEIRNEISYRLIPLEDKTERLEFYMSRLTEQQRKVIKCCYFDKMALSETATFIKSTVWIVRKLRDSAVNDLVKMYNYVGNGE